MNKRKSNTANEFAKLLSIYYRLVNTKDLTPELINEVREKISRLNILIDVIIENPKADYDSLYKLYKNNQ